MREIERKAGTPHGRPLSPVVLKALEGLRGEGSAEIICSDESEAKRVQSSVLTSARRYVEGPERVASKRGWTKGRKPRPVVAFTLVRAAEVA